MDNRILHNKQVEENKHLLNLKKLSNEIIMGRATEDTAMELDGEGTGNFEQLKDLICKECDKRDSRYAHLEDKYKKLEHQFSNQDQQKTWQRGADNQQATDQVPRRKTNPTKGKLPTNEAIAQEAFPKQHRPNKPKKIRKPRTSRRKQQRYKAKKRKQTYIALAKQIRSESMQCYWKEKTATEATTKKLISQFGFATDPTLST